MDTHHSTPPNGQAPRPETEVITWPTRRRFTVAYKQRILDEAERCTKPGEIGALLRREGLYSSNLSTWRRQRARGEFAGAKPGRKPASQEAKALKQLQRENARLKQKLEQAETIIDVQKNGLGARHLLGGRNSLSFVPWR